MNPELGGSQDQACAAAVMKDSVVEIHQTRSAMAAQPNDPQAANAELLSETATPPVAAGGKRGHPNGKATHDRQREGSEAVDADALSKALKEFEESGRSREQTPIGSPSRKRQRIYGDRLVHSVSYAMLVLSVYGQAYC